MRLIPPDRMAKSPDDSAVLGRFARALRRRSPWTPGRRATGAAAAPDILTIALEWQEQAESWGMNPGSQGSQVTRHHQPEQETASWFHH